MTYLSALHHRNQTFIARTRERERGARHHLPLASILPRFSPRGGQRGGKRGRMDAILYRRRKCEAFRSALSPALAQSVRRFRHSRTLPSLPLFVDDRCPFLPRPTPFHSSTSRKIGFYISHKRFFSSFRASLFLPRSPSLPPFLPPPPLSLSPPVSLIIFS